MKEKISGLRDDIIVLAFMFVLWLVILFLPEEQYDDDF